MGIRDKPTAPASPWQNGFAERLVGSIRHECVDHIIILGEAGAGYSNFMPTITTVSEPIDLWTRMRRFLGQFTGPVSFVHTPFWADCITNMFVFRFSVHTMVCPNVAPAGLSTSPAERNDTPLLSAPVKMR